MTDAPDDTQVVVTMEGFLRFLEGVCFPQPHNCPCCGSVDWSVGGVARSGEPVVGMVYARKTATPHDHAVVSRTDIARPYIPAECTICGYTRLFLYYRVLDWVIANPGEVLTNG